MEPIPPQHAEFPNGAVDDPGEARVAVSRRRPRAANGRSAAMAPAGGLAEALTAPTPAREVVDDADGQSPALADSAPKTAPPSMAVAVALAPVGGRVPPLDPPPAPSADGLPDLRRRAPVPVVPWPLRLQRRLKEATRPGQVEADHDAVIARLMAALATGTRVVAGISSKGGTGKTATMLTAGLVLAQAPLARPILVELNPDWGTLDEVLGAGANPRTIQDLLRDYTAVDRTGIGLLQGYVTMFGRLPVLTAPGHPDAMARLTPRDYDRVLRLLSAHYNVVLCDCGTSFTNRINQWAIQRADHLMVVGWPEQATLRKVLGAVDYLASSRYAHDYRGVLAEVEQAEVRARALADQTLVLNGVGYRRGPDPVDPAKVRAAAGGLNAVVELPHSPALGALLADGTLTMDALPAPYRRAVKRLLVAVLGRLADV